MKTSKKRVPNYWWDFRHNPKGMDIIVESDDNRFPLLATFDANEEGIEKAESLITSLKAGRINPKKLIK